jgi:hypothetical protein
MTPIDTPSTAASPHLVVAIDSFVWAFIMLIFLFISIDADPSGK